MRDFARVTKLSNIAGRADYISNPKRQEKIVAKSAPVDWQPYRRFEQTNQRTASKNNEGREVIIALPNSWARLLPWELQKRAQALAETAIGKKTDMQWAVHWNKARTDLHLHVVFSERQKENVVGVWDRDIYLTAEGKVARSKAERATLPDGSVAPPVHRKGEAKGGFTAKDTKYKTQKWVYEMKGQLRDLMRDRWRVKFDEPQLLHEYHEGKGKDAPKIREKNEVIRAINKNYAELMARPDVPDRTKRKFEAIAVENAKQGIVIFLHDENTIGVCDLQHWRAREARLEKEAKNTRKGIFKRSEAEDRPQRTPKPKKRPEKPSKAVKSVSDPIPDFKPIQPIYTPEKAKEREETPEKAKPAGMTMGEYRSQISSDRAEGKRPPMSERLAKAKAEADRRNALRNQGVHHKPMSKNEPER